MIAGEVRTFAGASAGPLQCAELDVAAPGILTLEARGPAEAESEPHLILAGEMRPGRVLVRQASHLTFVVPAGRQRFCVDAQDPRRGLGEVKLVTAFVELPPPKNSGGDEEGEDPREMEDEPGLLADPWISGFDLKDGEEEGEDPREMEDEPGLLADPWISGFDLKNGEEEGEDPREMEDEPGLLANPASFAAAKAELCRRLAGPAGHDDHGDSFLCATPAFQGYALAGELHSPWGDDRDVFELTVTRLETIEIRTSGEVDTSGGLYDERGYRLAVDEDDGDGGNFRLVKTLLPGRYFIQVESARRHEGEYLLHIGSPTRIDREE